jgi:hypothetical protein
LGQWNYLLTKDKTAIIKEWNQQMTDSYIRAVGTPKGVPLGESDSIYLYDTEDSTVTLAVAPGVTFPVTFNYLFSLETGYKVVPYDIQDATMMLIDDIKCGKWNTTRDIFLIILQINIRLKLISLHLMEQATF